MTTETTKDRLRLILGQEGLERLERATVMVIGLGGVGSNCAEALARGGVGNLVLLDRDVVAPSNVNRQAIAYTSTIGRPKSDVMQKMVLDINPEANVVSVQAFLEKDRVEEQLGELPRPDYVVDAIDTVAQKLQLASWCQELGIPEISAMGGGNKLLLPLEGEPVLAHTLRAIDAATLVDEIILATRTECLAEMAELCRRCGLQKPVRVVVGGETRTHSVLAAALEANEKARLIAVHDGARPLIRPEQIDELIRFGERTYAAAPAVPVSDTIKRTEPSTGRVLETPDRAALFAVQTPQVFQAELLKAALQSAVNAEVTLTDDCSAVERLGKEVYLTAGDPENIKITTPLDLRLAEAILAERRKQA